MKYLLDTNILIQARKGKNAPLKNALHAKEPRNLCYSTVTEMELLTWESPRVLSVTAKLLVYLTGIPFDDECAASAAQLIRRNKGVGMEKSDAMIAGTAIAKGLVLVSDDRVFARLKGLSLENWTAGDNG